MTCHPLPLEHSRSHRGPRVAYFGNLVKATMSLSHATIPVCQIPGNSPPPSTTAGRLRQLCPKPWPGRMDESDEATASRLSQRLLCQRPINRRGLGTSTQNTSLCFCSMYVRRYACRTRAPDAATAHVIRGTRIPTTDAARACRAAGRQGPTAAAARAAAECHHSRALHAASLRSALHSSMDGIKIRQWETVVGVSPSATASPPIA